ncbi:hypothetical protein [Amycolatopsis mediterranei]|nr:hypothetical protein [Amycolatopsis mediterranei]UZF67659.1 hypothetical protein ISP_000686 [Amycolatopsis mediterranei]
MSFAEDLVKAILTEFVTWLILLWVPALAAAVPTCGASLSAAAPVTEVKAAQTTAKTTRKVNKLRELLQKVLDWLRSCSRSSPRRRWASRSRRSRRRTRAQTSSRRPWATRA